MAETAVITVNDAIRKDNGWYELKDTQDRVFSTKKGEIGDVALGLKGQQANIEFTTKQNGEFVNRYIDSITAIQGGNGASTPLPSAQKPDGTADWDIVGLRKTRCALWAQYIGETIPIAAAWWSKNNQNASEADLLMFLGRVGAHMVVKAETDIYHRPPAVSGEDIPFG